MRELLIQQAIKDSHASERGATSSALGKLYSKFGCNYPTQDFDGIPP